MKPKLTIWNAFNHLIYDLIETWRTMDIRRWTMKDTLAVVITFILLNAFIRLGALVYQLL